MIALITFAFFLVVSAGIGAYGYRKYAKPARMLDQLGPATLLTMPEFDKLESEQGPGLLVRVVQKVGEQVPISPADAGSARRELIAAGYRRDNAVQVLYGAKVLGCVLFIFLGFVFRAHIDNNILRNLLLIAMAGAGYMAPTFLLEKMVDNRHERLRYGLPDALDLMVIAVEAGLGMDQAVQYVSRELAITHPDISDEFGLVTLEMRAGKRRIDALRNLAERARERELKKLVAILVQTDKFGTSIADSLRTHSDFMRVRRRQEAEERAGKVGVKMVFPIFFCILPAIMVVAAGPGLLQVFKYLFPMMQNFGN